MKGLLERLKEGPVVGDGSMCMTLEKRGYCRAGQWTPEAVLEYPDAVKQLLREYLRAGADVLQTPCYASSDGRLKRGRITYTTAEINAAACDLAYEVAQEGNALVCGGITPVLSYLQNKGEEAIREEFNGQLDVFIKRRNNVDFILGEFFGHIEELEICVDVMKKAKMPIACTMRIGALGDLNGVSVEECAVRMAKTGADLIGLNCLFDLNATLKTLKRMKNALDAEGITTPLMCQPLGFMCPEVEHTTNGYSGLPENPLAQDPRQVTRFEVHKFAREAYNLGARYIGGCCGMEPHHIRAIAQELAPERNRNPPVQDMCPPCGFLDRSCISTIKKKVRHGILDESETWKWKALQSSMC
uniref:betaine--homocysteine S-methyltransferase 1-like n=1 Tax=Ciona intestinalis TaxID=7719 RepID=UPI00006A422C|nr:betaine--homocysteine S-methyltransferase 1-like [Ciona intestinalis]|eukprot:XP_026690795.1 betaine--homocysteine S-methyltransferase 1-like [Ciona intestinalis]